MKRSFFPVLGVLLLVACLIHLLVSREKYDGQMAWWVVTKGAGLFTSSQPAVEAVAGLDMIFWDVRLPRTLAAVLVGLCLGAAGALTQGVFRNSLAEPSLLGSTSLAGFCGMLVFHSVPLAAAYYLVPAAAVIGAFAGTTLLILLSQVFADRLHAILLAGYAVNALFASLTSVFMSQIYQENLTVSGAFYWLLGAITTPTYWQLLPPSLLAAATLFWSYRQAHRLDVLNLGSEIAANLGIRVLRTQTLLILAVSALVGAALAVSGPIAFVGLVAPHVSRMLIGPCHRTLLPASAMVGGALVVLSDFIAKTVIYPREIEVGIILSFVGAPYFIYLLVRGGRSAAEFRGTGNQ